MTTIGAKYLFQCKANYHNNIRPSNKLTYENEDFEKLVEIAKEYFENGKKDDFLMFFEEYQYCVNLWTAHLVIEYGDPIREEKEKAIEIIERYSETPLNEELAKEEKQWLINYLSSEEELS